MSISPNRAQMHAALQSIQMHAAGMHAAADLALRLLSEMGQQGPAIQSRAARHGGPQHYGDPAAEVEELIARAGGSAPISAPGADTPPAQE